MTPTQREGLRMAQQQPSMRDLVLTCIAVLVVILLTTAFANARWKAAYSESSPEVRAWYQRQTTTPETRKRLKAPWYKFCCDDADTVEAKFEKRDGKWVYQRPGETEWHVVPDDAVQADVMTPGSKPVLFVDTTYLKAGPVCFFPGGTGT